jgi:hypothetical protein
LLADRLAERKKHETREAGPPREISVGLVKSGQGRDVCQLDETQTAGLERVEVVLQVRGWW